MNDLKFWYAVISRKTERNSAIDLTCYFLLQRCLALIEAPEL